MSRAVTRLGARGDGLRAGSHTLRSGVESRPGYVPTSDVGRRDSLLSPGGFLRSGRLGHGSASPRTPRLSTDLAAQALAEFVAERFDVTTRSIRVLSRPSSTTAFLTRCQLGGRTARRQVFATLALRADHADDVVGAHRSMGGVAVALSSPSTPTVARAASSSSCGAC